jgi:hypothetical protein
VFQRQGLVMVGLDEEGLFELLKIRELAAILNIEQHPREQPRDFVGAPLRTKGMRLAGQVIDGGDAAFVVQVAHQDTPAAALASSAKRRRERSGTDEF